MASRPRRGLGAVEILLAVGLAVGANVLAARHYHRADWTRGQTFALSEKTVAVVRALSRPVEIVVFMIPAGEGAHDLYRDARELLERARREAPEKLSIEYVDVDREPERLRVVGKRFGVSGDDLVSGVIVVSAGEGRTKFITRAELADYDLSDEEGPRLTAWKGEQALVSALLEVTEAEAPLVCFTAGHGEPAIDSFEPGEYGDFAEELRRDHHRVQAVDLSTAKVTEIPAECAVTVVAGPQQTFGDADVAMLERVLERGGRLLVLVGPTFDAKVAAFAPTGLEPLLERWGVALKDAVVVDEPRLRGSAVAFAVSEGYSDHPITRRLLHHRTLWSDARPVRAVERPGLVATELLHTTDAGWGETNLAVFEAKAELAYDAARDLAGPLPLGVAVERKPLDGKSRARLVVFGSSEIAGNRQILGANRDLLLGALGWLREAAPRVTIGPRTPEHLRLQLDDGQLRRVFWLCVVALPLLVLVIGLGVSWVRRS
jgi:hypothetical protein